MLYFWRSYNIVTGRDIQAVSGKNVFELSSNHQVKQSKLYLWMSVLIALGKVLSVCLCLTCHSFCRENILFGRRLQNDRYKAVLSACALQKDLQQLGSGDLTDVGPRGIMLSGGQQARIALARALYQVFLCWYQYTYFADIDALFPTQLKFPDYMAGIFAWFLDSIKGVPSLNIHNLVHLCSTMIMTIAAAKYIPKQTEYRLPLTRS